MFNDLVMSGRQTAKSALAGFKWLVSIFVFLMVLSIFSAQPAIAGSGFEQPGPDDWHVPGDDAFLEDFARANDLGNTAVANVLPDPVFNPSVSLPLGQESVKISVDVDGVYQVTYAELAAAGMAVGSANPNTFQMMNRGEAVAFQFIGDGDAQFEPGEAIRFYGQSVNHFARMDRQYVTENVYWLWAGGAPSHVATGSNPGGYTQDNAWLSDVTLEEDLHYFGTWTANWPAFPNDPDAWFMDRLIKGTESILSEDYIIDLPHPAASGADASFIVEVNSRSHPVVSGIPHEHEVDIFVNGAGSPDGTDSWYSVQNRNIDGTVSLNRLNNGNNTVQVALVGLTGGGSGRSFIYPNRITFNYLRQYIADDNQLIFAEEEGGNREFRISGYSENNAGNIIVWNITDPRQPVAIPISGGDLSGGVLRVGSSHAAGADFIATTQGNLQSAVSIVPFTASDLHPASGTDWLAISYGDFIAETGRLASHRALPVNGGLATTVVNVEQVVNQYGYGLRLPDAIRFYLAEALYWPTPPSYVLLVGDGTINPRHLDCALHCAYPGFNEDKAPNYVPTPLLFVDRFQGQIPVDPALAMLTGNDGMPDLPIGRLPVRTVGEMENVVDKIIEYEAQITSPETWMKNILFISDNSDSGGVFCSESHSVGNALPASFNQMHHCLPTTSPADVAALRDAMFNAINNDGALIMNYRGHGSIDSWAGGDIMTEADIPTWTNSGKLPVLLSADCLDGYFAFPGNPALSESLLEKEDSGTAGHWSSSGLGFSWEHNILHENFYTGLFDEGQTAVGDAIQFAKQAFFDTPGTQDAELYAFTYQGDPAMQLMRPDYTISKHALQDHAIAGDAVEYVLEIANQGLFPVQAAVTDTLPATFSFVSAISSVPVSSSTVGNDVFIDFQSALGLGESALVTITAELQTIEAGTGVITNTAQIQPAWGQDVHQLDNASNAPLDVCEVRPPLSLISQDTTNLQLSWNSDPGVSGYRIYRGINTPYLQPDPADLIATVGAGVTSYQDDGVTGSPANHHFYIVQPVECDGTAGESNGMGEFEFGITPGS